VKFLVDEDLSETVAESVNPVGRPDGHEFVHIRALGYGGATDDEIPGICRENGFSALITLNVRDFGARRHYFAVLLDHGIHVVVGRHGRSRQLSAANQAALILNHYDAIVRRLRDADSPRLLRVTESAVVERDLDQLIHEITGGTGLP
jgi:predicted nuclease of predicted toxin-antitoxin system